MSIFVQHVHPQLTNDDVKALVEQEGIRVVSVSIATDRYTRKSKGMGVIHLHNAQDVERAVQVFHGRDVRGQVGGDGGRDECRYRWRDGCR